MKQTFVNETDTRPTAPSRLNFSDGNHLLHAQVLYEWLPAGLRDAPLIDWTKLPSSTIAYLTNSVDNSPFAGHIALALICAAGALKGSSLKTVAALLNGLLRRMQQKYDIHSPDELTHQKWQAVVAESGLPPELFSGLKIYKHLTTKHLPEYLDQLTQEQRTQIQPYLLPSLPRRFWQDHVDATAIEEAGKRRRKEKTDVLAPLHHLLVALVRLRKQAVERMHHAYQEARSQVASDDALLPLAFAYQEELVTVNQDARTVSELRLEKRQVTLSFLLWDRRSWVLSHPNDYSSTTTNEAKKQAERICQAAILPPVS